MDYFAYRRGTFPLLAAAPARKDGAALRRPKETIMSKLKVRRALCTWVLLAAFGLPLVSAGPLGVKGAHRGRGFWLGAWSCLAALWEKNGAVVDPDGKPATPAAPAPTTPAGVSTQGDNGAQADPDGSR